MAENENKFVVDGREYPIPEKLTLGELADVEGITGQAYDPEKAGAKMTLALLFVSMRRVDPDVTLESIRDLDPDQFKAVEPEETKGDDGPPVKTPAPEPEETPGPSGHQP